MLSNLICIIATSCGLGLLQTKQWLWNDCREADESRLREVCEGFLGPPTGIAEEPSSDSNNLAWDPFVLVSFKLQLQHISLERSSNLSWPTKLRRLVKPRNCFAISYFLAESLQGMRKHKLLREDILPSMASNRKVQRLLNEFMDLLSEYEVVDPNQDQMALILPKSSSPATKPIENSSVAIDKEDGAQAKTSD